MFYPAEMSKVTIGVHNSYDTRMVRDLHDAGVLEIISIRDEKSSISDVLEKPERSPLTDTISDYILRLERVFELFSEIPVQEESLLKGFLSPRITTPNPVTRRPVRELFRDVEELSLELARIPEIREELALNKEEKERLLKEIEAVEFVKPLGLRLEYIGDTEFVSVIAGRVDTEKVPGLLQDIEGAAIEEIFISQVEFGNQTLVLIVLPRTRKEEIAGHIRAPRFQSIQVSCTGMPDDALAQMKAEYSVVIEETDRLLTELAGLKDTHGARLRALREELGIEKEEQEIRSSCGRTDETTFIEGWARADDIGRIENTLDAAAEGHIFIHSGKTKRNQEDVPVDYNNPWWLKPFEVLTTTFARPLYGEIDPTPFIAPIFILFFGLMMGDAAYGIILTICGLFLYSRIGPADPGMRDMSFILVFCGISATLFGAVQGGWFGDLLPRYFDIAPPFVLLEPLKDPIAFFQISLLIGVVHINLGLFLAFFQNVKSGAYRTMVFEQGVWFIIQPCAAVLLASFFAWTYIPPVLITVAEAGGLAGLVMIFYYNGPMGFFGLTGFLGDWLSYVRIMALSLATGGIAMTINILAGLISAIHPLMIIPAVFIFVGGQIFNLVIQSLGGVIHAIRLQYIEFFGKFYTGGGRGFSPFRAERRYTTLKGGNLEWQ